MFRLHQASSSAWSSFTVKVLLYDSTSIDSAIVSVSGIRADFGALQNRLQSTINNMQVSVENLSAANSRVRDTDVAAETANLTKQSILMQAGVSVLSQANSSTKTALTLIGSAGVS